MNELPLSRRHFLGTTLASSSLALIGSAQAQATQSTDVFVYGSTPGGIAAALEAARRGCRVILACPKVNPGGMTASGLCTTDAVRRELFGALVEEFITRVRTHYLATLGANSADYPLTRDGWFYEPSVAEKVIGGHVRRAG
ncbi:MAG: FAD-dependent oxidoreductase [Verrucomicrobiales bacterium]|nr:FAD-dependent oxidoreductase [Verrucomicrobiales bacterium]